MIYSFFVTNSLANHQSYRVKSFKDYGWLGRYDSNGLKNKLIKIVDLENKDYFHCIDGSNKKDDFRLREAFNKLDLDDHEKIDICKNRGAFTKKENNIYISMFAHIRNCLAHGKFNCVINDNKDKMIIFQDDGDNVTA